MEQAGSEKKYSFCIPPRKETIKPPIMAVISPCCGLTPEAIPKAIANGRATIPPIIPAMRSAINFSLE